MQLLRDIAQTLTPWVTLVGLIVHCWLDKKRFVRKDSK